jgi:small-conductance mechanosensitive channel
VNVPRLKIWILSILFLILGSQLPAAVIDKSLLDANVTRYRALLQHLEKETGGDPLQQSLQKALLQRLILLEESPPKPPHLFETILSKHPTGIEGYRLLFRNMIDAAVTLDQLQQRLKKLQKELEVLKNDLGKSHMKKKDLFTLQLQYLYTYRQRKKLQEELQDLEDSFAKFPAHFLQILDTIDFEAQPIRKELQGLEEKLRGLERSAEDLTLEKERLTLLGNAQERVELLERGLQSTQKARDELLHRKAEDLSLLLALALKERNKEAFTLAKKLEEVLREMGLSQGALNRISDLILEISQRRFGIATTLQSAAGEELSHTAHLFWQKINAPIFTINDTPISPIKILVTLLIFSFGVFIGVLYKRAVQGFQARNLTEATRTLLSNMGYYLIVIVAFFVALHFLGINLSSIALVAGALSVGIGFGLQNIVSNFISGIILMFERSIKIGDYIELSDTLSGRVTDIRMRSITITTNANIDIIVPNQELIQNRVINWTMNDKIRRFEIPFGVAYGTDPGQVISVVMEAVGKSGFEDIYTSRDRQTQVIMTGMGDSSVNFTLFVWIKGAKTLWPKRTTSRFLILIYNALNEAGITIPFPQRDLHIRSVDRSIPLILQQEREPGGAEPSDSSPDLSKS